MSAPMRIQGAATVRAAATGDEFKYYLDRLLKMIPGEVISLYLIGQGLIPVDQGIALVVWAVVCLGGVVAVRALGTRDPQASVDPDWMHVGISSIAFVIWVYTLGGPFKMGEIWLPWLGSLLVLAWTFFVPLFYRGPD